MRVGLVRIPAGRVFSIANRRVKQHAMRPQLGWYLPGALWLSVPVVSPVTASDRGEDLDGHRILVVGIPPGVADFVALYRSEKNRIPLSLWEWTGQTACGLRTMTTLLKVPRAGGLRCCAFDRTI